MAPRSLEKAFTELGDLKARMQQETTTLGGELSRLRAASTSLTHGVLRSLQIIGLINSEMEIVPKDSGRLIPRRYGVEVGDLLDWEGNGQSLAARVGEPWKEVYIATGAESMLSLMKGKASEQDLRAVDYSLRLLGGPPGTVGSSLPTSNTNGAQATNTFCEAAATGKKGLPSPVLAGISQGGSGTVSGRTPQVPSQPRGEGAAPQRSVYSQQPQTQMQ